RPASESTGASSVRCGTANRRETVPSSRDPSDVLHKDARLVQDAELVKRHRQNVLADRARGQSELDALHEPVAGYHLVYRGVERARSNILTNAPSVAAEPVGRPHESVHRVRDHRLADALLVLFG